MPGKLPINLNDLLRQRTVEGERIEYKSGWNPDPILRTICAFANDFENLGGGYVVIGQDCDHGGQPVFPPVGIASNQLDKIQQELLACCNNLQPPYFPVLSVKIVEGRNLLVLWAPGGQNRPYKVPASVTAKHKTWHYYPYAAVEEAGVNAVYHRSYEEREPIEVRIGRDELVVLSFPGPDRSIRMDDLRSGRAVSRRYRNRRIGEFLKELDLTEGRATGIPKILKEMAVNGSPPPVFETDDERSSFVIRLPAHSRSHATSLAATAEVTALLAAIKGDMPRQALQDALGLRHAEHFRKAYLLPALDAKLIEMTLPNTPRSSKQRYRLTAQGLQRRRQTEAPQ